ncbi:MAG: UDP-N-acetylmuramoyl-L-alanine--D-glutamate ligase [Chloroflexi bacterium]|nr:UDP-N-acetylmuramoyl-L-alanine--D-glutamate ligase [Chloroflexota bacterium]MYD15584.1 UDP-N-acetylmuramoyl-L-alanine--D-glutamate ligase [Chloroflexota bacterium]MYJ01704.1 UDP-N-acetylmuramoyl-L-alanine--D-glutamate ligase [Chloroflexota bacterium]
MSLPQPIEAPASFTGQRVAVVGMGIEGRDAFQFLVREGAEVVTVDRNPRRAMRDQDDVSLLQGLDALIASQGVPWDSTLLVEAARRGLPVFGPTQVFFERCLSNRVIGITGSAGKTTTTTLVHELLSRAEVDCVLGGNIGRGLLGQLPDIAPDTTVVAELSHTQLLRTTRSPQVAAITNITPNHLDQFDWDDYQALKYRIVEYQTGTDRVVLPFDEPRAAHASRIGSAVNEWFGIGEPPCRAAAHCDRGRVFRNGRRLMDADELKIPGQHNLRNALAALAIVGELVSDEAAAAVLSTFAGVPHRLELVAELDGVRFVNDSIATTPERTLAGIRAIDGPIVLMLGGRDKRLPLDPLVDELRRRVRRAVLFGETGAAWAQWCAEQGVEARHAGDLASAFAETVGAAQPGDAVLLSPGGTSFDAYPNFEARGQHFRDLVEALRPKESVADER